jgi:hypothetical protein
LIAYPSIIAPSIQNQAIRAASTPDPFTEHRLAASSIHTLAGLSRDDLAGLSDYKLAA